MAETSNVETRHQLSLTSPHHISKEVQGIDGSIPLSPQWLLPKPGENKPGKEPHRNSHPSYASHADAVKALGVLVETFMIQKSGRTFSGHLFLK